MKATDKNKKKISAEDEPLPEPCLWLDFTGEPRALATASAAAPRHADRHQERKVIQQVRALEDMSFGRAPDEETLAKGTPLEHVQPNESEAKDLQRLQRMGRQHLVVLWKGKARLLPSDSVERIL